MVNKEKKIPKAFTLVELLVVITIIALLLSILMTALAKARKLGKQIRSSSCARQLLLAYNFYSSDNDDRLLWGYPPQNVNGKDVLINDNFSGYTFGYPVSSRYPWHISKYVADIWGVVYSHGKVPQRPSSSDSYSDALMKAYYLSVSPTFGLNSIYLGGHGHPFYKGFIYSDGTARPNHGSHVVYKATNVRHSTRQIVFAESTMIDPTSVESETGYHLASPPHANGELWRTENNKIVKVNSHRILGLPRGRYSAKTIIGFFDGHVDTLSAKELDDMTLWANKAKGKDYDFAK